MEKSGNITICRIGDTSKYLPRIDRAEVDDEICDAIAENGEAVCAVCLDGEPVGFSVTDDGGAQGFLYVTVFPEYRKRGYGRMAAQLSEQRLGSPELRKIVTSYHQNNAAARRFAEKCGFAEQYASARMAYRGERFTVPALPVRQYEAKDYPDAFMLSAEAFHKMRVETGCFPDSVPGEPDEKSREYWLKTAEERYVYILEDEVVGCAHVDGAELDAVSIKISRQGKGLGKGFVQFLVNLILDKEIGAPCLWCVVGNDKARRLYDSLGFEEVSREAFAVKKIPERKRCSAC